ncbi:Putative F-box only protein 31/39 [Septoria linicola]|uniref:F-box only protein 31/39 n=1 Tax=Septoria linicola TaxID=215465 RepID=A0A9Q9ACL1_9PEZI|nr:putative F-box only protein 31/39 [Septoria linicola]USW47074.1 Putative F-box only protein 31/39 [Septoria linicola]
MSSSSSIDNAMHASAKQSTLAGLPAEIHLQILAHLEPLDLAQVAQTCQRLALTSYDESLWSPIVDAAAGQHVAEFTPLSSFRELYASLFPYWFLTSQRIWFGDNEPSGKFLVTRYDPATQSIVAYQVVALARATRTISFWEKNPSVIIYSFDPVTMIDTNQPVLKLDAGNVARGAAAGKSVDRGSTSRYAKDVLMDTFLDSGLHSAIMLCRALPAEAITHNSETWPPHRIPAASRARNASRDGFRSMGHKPEKLSQLSKNNFRLKKWVEYHGRDDRSDSASSGNTIGNAFGIGLPYFLRRLPPNVFESGARMPEDITTFCSLPPESYTPTKEKPWQGIWCGDYSVHGCEFLLVTQPDESEATPLPRGLDYLREWFSGARLSSAFDYDIDPDDDPDEDELAQAATENASNGSDTSNEQTFMSTPNAFPFERSQDHSEVPSGRLEAIKLTGDPNVPRSQYSFIAPDLGHGGFLRIADEATFRGARVVRSAGHVANRGFIDDEYKPSQLIMISHDRLAQFWQGFSHISYYRRVDLDNLIKNGLSRAS